MGYWFGEGVGFTTGLLVVVGVAAFDDDVVEDLACEVDFAAAIVDFAAAVVAALVVDLAAVDVLAAPCAKAPLAQL